MHGPPQRAGAAALAAVGGGVSEKPRSDSPTIEAGSAVEVYSASAQAWCPGRVESVRGNKACVAFRMPCADAATGGGGGAREELAHKVLPVGHEHLRVAAAPSGAALAPSAATAPAKPETSAEEFHVGETVEVYSLSRQAWCPGVVERVRNGFVLVEYHAPWTGGSPEPARKEIPAGHCHLRRREGPLDGRGQEAAPSSDTRKADEPSFRVGDTIEVYSTSRQTWCTGWVEAVNNAIVTTVYCIPDGDMQQKELPVSHEHLRKPLPKQDSLRMGEAVEVFHSLSNSWCPGRVVARGAGDAMRVAYLPPGAGGEEWAEKEVALGQVDVRRSEPR